MEKNVRHITVADRTLCGIKDVNNVNCNIEKTGIVRCMEKLGVNIIELPTSLEDSESEKLFASIIPMHATGCILSYPCGGNKNTVADIVKSAEEIAANVKPGMARMRLEIPVSTLRMTYLSSCNKPDLILKRIEAVVTAVAPVLPIEFCAIDAPHAEVPFLVSAVQCAERAGATAITLCDDTGDKTVESFAEIVAAVKAETKLPIGVVCCNRYGLASAQALAAIGAGATVVKCGIGTDDVALDEFVLLCKDCGINFSLSSDMNYFKCIRRTEEVKALLTSIRENAEAAGSEATETYEITSERDLRAHLAALDYDLSEENIASLYREMARIAVKKKTSYSLKELDVLIQIHNLNKDASYILDDFLVTTNAQIVMASVSLVKAEDGTTIKGVGTGTGPIEAGANAISAATGVKCTLEKYNVDAVTKDISALGVASVLLEANGERFSGKGISPDVLEASIRAYLNAVNRIVSDMREGAAH